jgi:hypothetical protein
MSNKTLPAIGSPFALQSYDILSLWGDSRTQQNWSFSNTIPFPQTCGQYWWLEALSFCAVRLDPRYNFGVSGDRVDMLLYRMVNDVPNSYGVRPSQVPPSIAGLLIGTNTINGAAAEGMTHSRLRTQLQACVGWLQARGHKVILTAEVPRGGTTGNTLSAADLVYMQKYRDVCKSFASMENVDVVDPWARTSDYSRTDGRPQEGFLNVDDLHFSGGMGFVLGEEMAALDTIQNLPRRNYAPVNNADQYSADYPTGCLNLNPMLVQGTGGTLGSNAAGVVPQNYTLSTNNAGIVVTGSFVTTTFRGVPRPAFRMVIAGTPTVENAYASLRQTGLYGTKIVAGDRAFAGFECVAAAGHTNFSSPSLTLDTGVTATRLWGGSNITNFRGFPSQAIKGFEAMPLTIEEVLTEGTASLALDIRIQFADISVVSAMTIDLISAFARRP